MRVACITCEGRGVLAEQRQTVGGDTGVVTARCYTCAGQGSYDMLAGPGVDPSKRHGTGRADDQ